MGVWDDGCVASPLRSRDDECGCGMGVSDPSASLGMTVEVRGMTSVRARDDIGVGTGGNWRGYGMMKLGQCDNGASCASAEGWFETSPYRGLRDVPSCDCVAGWRE